MEKNKNLYFIAEIGSNFNSNYKLALKLIESAKNSGADAVKFQLFNPKLLYPNDKKMQKILDKFKLNKHWIPKLKKYCNSLSIDFLCSAFDMSSAKYLKKNKLIAHKIASSENEKIDLIKFLVNTNKKIYFSTGMIEQDKLEDVLENIDKKFYKNITLMQCTSLYPTKYKDVNLKNLLYFKKKFNCALGFSDHTLDYIAGIVAVGLGATVFEKHITLSKFLKGPDHFYALEPKQFKKYINSIKKAYKTLGNTKKIFLDNEKKFSRKKAAYVKKLILKGSSINNKNIFFSSPPLGLREHEIKNIKNLVVNKTKKKGEILKYDDIQKK